MENELKQALDNLKIELEGKTKEQAQGLIIEFEAKNKENVKLEAKSLFDTEIKGIKDEFASELKKIQDHNDKIDLKLQSKAVSHKNEDVILKALKDNFDSIKNVRKGQSAQIEIKAVGNMTLGNNLTGDQPRTYSNSVASIPAQSLNFSDLIASVNIGTGTYTFPREGAGEGAIATQVEGSAKSQVDSDFTMVDVNTDFIAGYQRYSKKMANNLPYLESFLPNALRRKYFLAENSIFNTALASQATASAQVITGKNKIEMLMNEVATLEGADFTTSGIVVTPADYWDILKIEKSTGAGYGLPGIVTLDGGVLRIAGIPLFRANWLAANKYYVGDWATVYKIVTEGLSLEFSTEEGSNFVNNNITARIEAQVGLAVERPDAIIYGDFTAV